MFGYHYDLDKVKRFWICKANKDVKLFPPTEKEQSWQLQTDNLTEKRSFEGTGAEADAFAAAAAYISKKD